MTHVAAPVWWWLALMLCLAACTQQQTAANPDILGNLSTFTITDLQHADADALAQNDIIASRCYEALMVWIPTGLPTQSNATVAGAFGAFQKGRDLRNQVKGLSNGGIPDLLLLGCGALIVQVQMDMVQFAKFIASFTH